MSRATQLREVAEAEHRLSGTRARWRHAIADVQRSFRSHPMRWLLGGGLAGGLAAGSLPIRPVLGWVRAATSVASLLLQPPLASVFGLGRRAKGAPRAED